jgi:hypothetical protein
MIKLAVCHLYRIYPKRTTGSYSQSHNPETELALGIDFDDLSGTALQQGGG